jgi:hypothetical protein
MSADTSHTSEDFSDIDMDELDSYLTSPPVRPADPPRSRDARVARPRAARLLRGIALGPRTSTASFQIVSSDRVEADRGDASIPPSVTPRRTQAMLNDDDDDGARAAARARLAARAAHGEGGMAAQAAAEAAVAAVATGNASALSDLDPNVLSSLHARTPVSAPAVSEGAQKRKHIISPPMKVHRRKGNSGAPGVNVARAARDLCGDLGEPKESLMRRAVDVIGVVEANALAIEVGAIEGAGGQMTSDGTRRRTPGGVFWALLKARASKEDWDFIFAEEKEAARERCRRRRRAQSANGSPEGTPKERKDLNGLLAGRFKDALAGLGASADATVSAAKTPFAVVAAPQTRVGVDDAPARLSMAERLSGVSATAKAFTPAAKAATPGSWAARAAAHTPAPAMRRARSAPAAALAAAANAKPAKNDESAGEEDFAVTTPDNDPAAANATPGGSYAARARAAAAAEAEAALAAQVRARAAKIAAANAAAKKKLAPAPAVAVADDAMEEMAPAPAPAPAWSVSFASVLRAV